MTTKIKYLYYVSFLLVIIFSGCSLKKPFVKMDNDFQLAKAEAKISEMETKINKLIDFQMTLQAKITAQLEAQLKNNMQGNIGQGNTNTAQDIAQRGDGNKSSINDSNLFYWFAGFAGLVVFLIFGFVGKVFVGRSETIQALLRVAKKEKENV